VSSFYTLPATSGSPLAAHALSVAEMVGRQSENCYLQNQQQVRMKVDIKSDETTGYAIRKLSSKMGLGKWAVKMGGGCNWLRIMSNGMFLY